MYPQMKKDRRVKNPIKVERQVVCRGILLAEVRKRREETSFNFHLVLYVLLILFVCK